MKTIIAGSRSIDSKDFVFSVIEDAIEQNDFEITEVVSGEAKGVDKIGEKWAEENNIDIKRFPYEAYLDDNIPKVAPLIRNTKMAEYAEQAIIVWDGESKGTKDMINKSKDGDLEIHIERTDTKTLDDF